MPTFYQQNYSSNIEASIIQRRPNVVRIPKMQLGYASSFRVNGQTIALTAWPYAAQVYRQMNYTAEYNHVQNVTVQSTHLRFGHRWPSESSGQRDTYQYQRRVSYSSLAAYGLELSQIPQSIASRLGTLLNCTILHMAVLLGQYLTFQIE